MEGNATGSVTCNPLPLSSSYSSSISFSSTSSDLHSNSYSMSYEYSHMYHDTDTNVGPYNNIEGMPTGKPTGIPRYTGPSSRADKHVRFKTSNEGLIKESRSIKEHSPKIRTDITQGQNDQQIDPPVPVCGISSYTLLLPIIIFVVYSCFNFAHIIIGEIEDCPENKRLKSWLTLNGIICIFIGTTYFIICLKFSHKNYKNNSNKKCISCICMIGYIFMICWLIVGTSWYISYNPQPEYSGCSIIILQWMFLTIIISWISILIVSIFLIFMIIYA